MVTARLQAINARIDQIDMQIRELSAERAGLQLERTLLLDTPAVGGLVGVERTHAITEVLRAAGTRMRPKEITDALRAAGRADDPRSVSATLNHLKQQGQAMSPTRGQWELSPNAQRHAE